MEDVSAHSQRGTAAAQPALPNCSEENLLGQVATGDHAAFTMLYDSVARAVYGLVHHIVDRPAADRVTQDVLVAVWRSAASFDGSARSARSWILGMAHRHAVDEIRGDAGTWEAMVEAGEPPELGAAPDADSVEPMVGGIEQALRHLPESQRAALDLAYFHGLTYWQVARTLNMSRSNASNTLRDALRGLATQADPSVMNRT